jgi:prefoldin subunit 5
MKKEVVKMTDKQIKELLESLAKAFESLNKATKEIEEIKQKLISIGHEMTK